MSAEVGNPSELLDEEVASMGRTDAEGDSEGDDDASELLGDCNFCAATVLAVLITGVAVIVIVVVQSHTSVAEALVARDEAK